MFVPVETVANNSNGISIVSIVHRQVQGHNAVTTCRIGECMRQVITGLRNASVFVPVEAVAGDNDGVTVGGVVHRQVQRHNAVAVCRIGKRVRQVITGLCNASMFVPVETVAGDNDGVTIGGVVYCQVQRHDAVTARRIGERMCQVLARLCNANMFVPIEAVASDGDSITIVSVIYCQVQRHDTVAACRIGERMRQVLTGLCKASVFVPIETVAGNSDGITIGSIVHRQMHGYHRITTIGIHERLCIVTRLSIGTTVPNIKVTCINCEIDCLIYTSRSGHAIERRLIASHINCVKFDTSCTIQIIRIRHHNIIPPIDTYRTILQMPIHMDRCISITCYI